MSKIYVDEILPKDNATVDGSKLSGLISSALPTGSVLQVVQATDSGVFSTSSSTFVSNGLEASITPSSTSSKILVFASSCGSNESAGRYLVVTFLRDGSNILGDWGTAQFFSDSGGGTRVRGAFSAQYLDSPGTTSEVTYALGIRSHNSDTVEVPPNAGHTQIMILMEIAG